MKNYICVACAFALLTFHLPSAYCSNDCAPSVARQSKPKMSEPVYDFKVLRDTLKVTDRVKLAVTYYMPVAKTKGEKFPVLFKMDPYRKDDFFYQSDYARSAYFARRGYVTARVDVRGTGGSEGAVPSREYSDAELDDAVEIISQLSKKKWSNGNVGMYGMSWSAFNSIMTAMRKPPALKAIITMHGSEDLFYNDVHYIDGVMHLDYYDQQIDTDNGLPQSIKYTMSKKSFENRFDREPWIIEELRQQRDGDFWRGESLRFNDPLEVPAYVIGGLLDGYRDYAPYIFETSKAPVKMDIGPYNHSYPNSSSIGPRYEWREIATRWWDYWLKGMTDNGILDEPRVTLFVRSGHEPTTVLADTPGKWRSETTWPISGTTNAKFYPTGAHVLDSNVPAEVEHSLAYFPGAGMAAGGWWGEPTDDMARDDAKSLVYDSQVLPDDIQIIGSPKVSLSVQSDAPLYQWTVRLEDLWPDGRVSLVSGALINPTQRNDRLNPEALVPGQTTTLSTQIHFTTWTFKSGHRIRLAISNAQFPMAWPTPGKGSTKLITGSNTWVELPIPPPPSLPEPVLPTPAEDESPADYSEIYSFGPTSGMERDEINGISTFTTSADLAWSIGKKNFSSSEFYTWNVSDNDPAGASYSGMRRDVFEIHGTSIVLYALFNISSDAGNFKVSISRTLLKNGKQIRTKSWDETIPRDFQ